MTISAAPLNNTTYDAQHASIFVTPGHGLTITNNAVNQTFVVNPTLIGLSTYDTWTGGPALNTPDPSDTISFTFQQPTPATFSVIQYSFKTGDGVKHPQVGFGAAEVLGSNATGYLLEQLSGFVPGQQSLTVSGQFFVVSASNLSTTNGFSGPSLADLTFTNVVPEPSAAMLLPLMAIALIATRMPSVRAFFAR